MNAKKSWLTPLVSYVVFILLIIVYIFSVQEQSLTSLPKITFTFYFIATLFIIWLIVVGYNHIYNLLSVLVNRSENIELLLLDIRDGTKHFFREKRRSFRIKTDIVARLTGKNSSGDFVKIADIGHDGALIVASGDFPSKEKIELDIYLPLFTEPIHVKAKVVRTHISKELADMSKTYTVGVEFAEISVLDKEKLVETVNILKKTSPSKLILP
jgi:hypothetical protein